MLTDPTFRLAILPRRVLLLLLNATLNRRAQIVQIFHFFGARWHISEEGIVFVNDLKGVGGGRDALAFIAVEKAEVVLIVESVVKRARFIFISVHAMDLMLKHDSQLEDVFFGAKSGDYKLENTVFLRLCHHFKQLIEAIGREDLPITL